MVKATFMGCASFFWFLIQSHHGKQGGDARSWVSSLAREFFVTFKQGKQGCKRQCAVPGEQAHRLTERTGFRYRF